ncbi:comEC/Rec2-related domain protein [Bordetella holmesii 70147]|nr:comEC/Rec2-related domain protein [Bordetella holmesii 70147]
MLDPWAVMTPGFWLSFAAVAILMRVALTARRGNWRARVQAVVADFCRMQMAVTLGLVPVLAFWVGEVSLVSPLANALAIPWVSLVVTPLALLTGVTAALAGQWAWAIAGSLGWAAHASLAVLMQPLSWLAKWPWGHCQWRHRLAGSGCLPSLA